MRAGTSASTFRGSIAPSTNPAPPVLCEPGARGGSHLGVVAADGAAALGGAAGVALAGVREGEVLLLAVPRAHHVHHGAVPAKGACGVGGTPRCRNHCSPGQRQEDPAPTAAPSAGSQLPGAPRGGPYLPEWMERFCPTYFISWGGPCSHTHCTAHASAALASRSSHTWRGGKERAVGIGAARGRQVGKPAPCVWRGGSEPLQLPPKPGLHVSLEKSCGKGANYSGDEPQPCPGEGFWKVGI